MGATVLHEEAIFPVKAAGIPINIRNTNSPDDCGTMIVSQIFKGSPQEDDTPVVTGIAGKKHFSVISLEKDKMNEELGFGRRVLEVLENFNLGFEHLPSGIDTMSVIVQQDKIENIERDISKKLFEVTNSDSISIEKGISLIAIVGHGMKNMRGRQKFYPASPQKI